MLQGHALGPLLPPRRGSPCPPAAPPALLAALSLTLATVNARWLESRTSSRHVGPADCGEGERGPGRGGAGQSPGLGPLPPAAGQDPKYSALRSSSSATTACPPFAIWAAS